jgi:dipeptidyl aminopeptidase/acylaminoacyl peptidase
MRKDITCKTEDGVTLQGWFYQPDDRDGPFPTLVMAHGFSASRSRYWMITPRYSATAVSPPWSTTIGASGRDHPL